VVKVFEKIIIKHAKAIRVINNPSRKDKGEY
jgi:hypothetical protein